MDRDAPRLARADLIRLRDAVRRIQQPRDSLPREEILALHRAVPKDTGLTIDLEASEQIGMPLLVFRVPVAPHPSPEIARLTPREFEVAGLIAAGLANKEIAARLGVRTSTVKEHVHRILAKTAHPNRAAVARAYVGGRETDLRTDRKHQPGGVPDETLHGDEG